MHWKNLTICCTILLFLIACGDKEAESDSKSPDSISWTQCYNIGDKWSVSYPAMTPELAYKLALRWNMCASYDGTNLPWLFECALSTCLSYECPYLDPPFMECLLAATDCDEVRCCWGIDSSNSCDPETFKAHCDGDVAVTCEHFTGGTRAVKRWDCAWSPGNPKCRLFDSHFDNPNYDEEYALIPSCSAGTCEPEQPSYCEGNILMDCEQNTLRQVDCAARGRICAPVAGESDSIEAACVLDTGCLLPHCDKHDKVICYGGAEVMRIDCRTYGDEWTCVDNGFGISGWLGICSPPELEFDPEVDDDYCIGDIARICTDGGWFEFDCSDFADGTCRQYWSSLPYQGDEPHDHLDPTQGDNAGCTDLHY
jgi:hypothetical protein